jgi:hypothetical protein
MEPALRLFYIITVLIAAVDLVLFLKVRASSGIIRKTAAKVVERTPGTILNWLGYEPPFIIFPINMYTFFVCVCHILAAVL